MAEPVINEDTAIVNRVKGGDVEAYGELIRKHHARVYNICAGMLGGGAPADDAAQDVFVRAFERLSSFRGDAAFTTWIHRLATNHCLDILRAQTRRRTDSWDGLLEAHGDRIETLLDRPGEAPGLSDELRETVNVVLSGLRPEYRAVLTLRETQGMRYDEMARVLNVSLDSVKARLKRARRDLELGLRHFLGGTPSKRLEQKR